MKTLNQLYNESERWDYQMSPHFLKMLHEPIMIQKGFEYRQLLTALLLMEITSKLGWAEHTSDWDIGANILTKDGENHYILQGYGDCLSLHDTENKEIPFTCPDYHAPEDTIGFTIQLTEAACDTDDEDVHPIKILIHDIKSISFHD